MVPITLFFGSRFPDKATNPGTRSIGYRGTKDPDLVNVFGQSPLFCASVNGHVEVVRLLVEAGADKDFAYNGETALTCASQSGHAEVVRLLVEAGANKDWANKEGGGYTALMHSASNGNFEIARFLVEAGVDKDAASEDGCT